MTYKNVSLIRIKETIRNPTAFSPLGGGGGEQLPTQEKKKETIIMMIIMSTPKTQVYKKPVNNN